ncbi:MAG: polysaccharide deacetylase family protein [candidate division Zixibacteria bacterium]|nr:polysaccharide deacetylase family protein [candidate division Zixibacteria bacterium]
MAILTFHHITDDLPLGLNQCSARRLKTILKAILDSGFKIIPLAEYVIAEDNSKLVAITFDDGYESFYSVAFPIFQEMNMPAAVFVPYNHISKTNSWDYTGRLRQISHLSAEQIKALSDSGIEIGSHGLSHISLKGLSNRLLRLELEKSKKGLEDITGREIKFISYPFGRFNEKVEKFALEVEYSRGFSLSFLRKSPSGFTLPRHAVYITDTPYSVLNKTGSGVMARLERLKGAIINTYAYGTIFLNRLRPGHLHRPD